MSRTLFIGDVHGCYDELIALLDKICITVDDHLYFVGDLINKGPKSLEVVQFVRSRPNTWCVLGNHEYFSLIPSDDASVLDMTHIGITQKQAEWWSYQYKKASGLRALLETHGHCEWLLSLPHILERENFIVVHGGLHPEYKINTPKEIATLIRYYQDRPWYEYYTGSKPVIYGHWAVDGLR